MGAFEKAMSGFEKAVESGNLITITCFGRTKEGKWHIASSIPLTDSIKDEFDLFLASGILEGRQDLLSDPADDAVRD